MPGLHVLEGQQPNVISLSTVTAGPHLAPTPRAVTHHVSVQSLTRPHGKEALGGGREKPEPRAGSEGWGALLGPPDRWEE